MSSYELKIICASYVDLAALVKTLDSKHTSVTVSAKPTPTKSKGEIVIVSQTDVTEEVDDLVEELEKVITSGEITQALKKLMNTVDRAAVTKVTDMCGVKKVSDIPVDMYRKVLAKVLVLMDPEVEAEDDDGLFPDEDEDGDAPAVETPTDSMLKKMASAMNTESRRDYKTMLDKYECKSAKSFVNLSDENKVKIFAEMNKYLA